MNNLIADTQQAPSCRAKWSECFRASDVPYVVTVFLMSRLCIFFIGYLANLRIEKFKYFQKMGHWLDPFFQWDAYWYLTIVRDGYSFTPGEPSNVNFFPLYPLLIKLVNMVWPDIIVSGFLVSNLALLVACFFLHRIAMHCCNDQKVARATVIAALVFPTSFYFSSYYTESLFLATALGAYYYALRRRWAVACVFAFLCGLTRQLGLLMLAPLVLEFFRINWGHWWPDFRDRKQGAWLLLAPCGLLAYMAYLYWQFGDPLAFSRSAAAWGKYLVMPWETLVTSYHMYSQFERLMYGGTIGIVIMALISMVYFRLPVSGIAFTVLMIGAILSMRILESSQRYILGIFPMYLALGRLVAHRDEIRFGFGMLSVLLLCLFTILFVSGYRMY